MTESESSTTSGQIQDFLDKNSQRREIRVPKTEAIALVLEESLSGIVRHQRDYAKFWGCSVSTANSWIRSAEQLPNSCRTESRTAAEQQPNRHRTAAERMPNTCRTCAEQSEQILALLQILVSSNSLVLKEKESSSLRSEEEHEPNDPNTEQPNTNRTTNAEHGAEQTPRSDFQLSAVPSPPKLTRIEARVVAAWPAIRSAFAEHGRNFSETPGKDRIKLIGKRIADGATAEQLVAAVHGYVQRHQGLEPDGDFDPGKHFGTKAIFKAEDFSDRVDFGMGPRKPIPPRATSSKPVVKANMGNWEHS